MALIIQINPKKPTIHWTHHIIHNC